MIYDNITRAIFLNRPNRFIAEVEIDGRREIVHVKNTGRCKELLIHGCEVWLTAPGTPGRKTKYDLVAVRKSNGILFNIDSQAPNKVVKEWLDRQNYDKVIPEYTYGASRIDFYMERGNDCNVVHRAEHYVGYSDERGNGCGVERYLMEVKGCTLEVDGIGYFPDAPTVRGVKHLRELALAANKGYKAILAFVIQMDGVSEVRANIETHAEFGIALDEARAAGVEVLYLKCHVEPGIVEIID